MNTTSVLIVGVGGQGSLLTSRILGTYAINMGLDVKVSEVHGMSQRGGSVVTYVRMGEEVLSPIIEEGGADFMLAFEMLEALRYVELLKKDGKVVVNSQEIDPMPVIIGACDYPDKIDSRLTKHVDTNFVNAVPIADELGNIRTVNTVMIGRLAKTIGTDKEKWIDAIKQCVPAKTVDLNIEAFNKGYEI